MNLNLVQKEDIDQLVVRIDKMHQLLRKVLSIDQRQDLLDNQAFCKKLSISKRTAQSYRDKKIISYTQIGSKILYKVSDVEAFLEKHGG